MIVKCTNKLIYYESYLINELSNKQDECISHNIDDITCEKTMLENKFKQHNKIFDNQKVQDILKLHDKLTKKITHPFTIKIGYQIKTVISLETITSIITVTYLLFDTEISMEEPIDYQFFVFDITKEINDVEFILKEVLNDIKYYKSHKIILNDTHHLEKVAFNCSSAAKLLHEVISHPLEEDHYDQNMPFNLNKRFFKSNITVIENFNITRDFDDINNTIQKNIVLIKDGVYANKLITKSTGNTYIDYFSDRKEPLVRTISCLFEINDSTDITKSYPYLEVVQIESGQYNPNTNTIVICITKSILHQRKDQQEKVVPFYLELSINTLLECELYRISDYDTQHSLCFKRGGIQHVIIRTPAIMIKSLSSAIIKYGGLNDDRNK